MSKFEVDTGNLDQVAKFIEDKKTIFDTEWQKIYSDLEILTTDIWTGYASEEYNASLTEYKAQFKKVSDNMKDYADELKRKSGRYVGGEDLVKTSVPKIR